MLASFAVGSRHVADVIPGRAVAVCITSASLGEFLAVSYYAPVSDPEIRLQHHRTVFEFVAHTETVYHRG